eukprot:CAMPEP_0197032168 /NCGR_PEP_ID=MMETSP1384-20130603/10913_1 /TAXON_ID=29189 /ORGANISM="Ammonia sp." /LENGTH=130 /DNA_ID=CAMNT_0042461787 /DNA_START=103 /DNA_END=498 /DNA_ORIENTATION=-
MISGNQCRQRSHKLLGQFILITQVELLQAFEYSANITNIIPVQTAEATEYRLVNIQFHAMLEFVLKHIQNIRTDLDRIIFLIFAADLIPYGPEHIPFVFRQCRVFLLIFLFFLILGFHTKTQHVLTSANH